MGSEGPVGGLLTSLTSEADPEGSFRILDTMRPDPPGERILGHSRRANDGLDGDYSLPAIKGEETEDPLSDNERGGETFEDEHEEDFDEDSPNAQTKEEEDDETQWDAENKNDEEEPEGNDPILDFVPDCSKANALPFPILCARLEVLWEQRFKKVNRQSKDTLWEYLMPDSLRRYIDRGSYFPLLRLLLPDLDTSRPHTGMKERTIAIAWADALGFTRSSRVYQRLIHFNDPTINTSAAGDLSMVVFEIMKDRFKASPSKLNLGAINHMLDELVAIRNGPLRSSHDWRESQYTQSQARGPRKDKLRQRWVEKLLGKCENPLEHKWMVRILLQKMEVGFGSKTILSRYNSEAMVLYRMNNNLKSVCTTLANPEWWKRHKAKLLQQQASQQEGYASMLQ